MKPLLKLLLFTVTLFWGISNTQSAVAQTTEEQRLKQVEDRLRVLAVTSPGLTQKVQLSVSGATAQEFLRALAKANNLNINADPQLNFKVFNNFNEETALNVLLFLAKEYTLDIRLTGSIMTISKVPPAQVAVPVRQVSVGYNPEKKTLSYELNNDTLSNVLRKISQVAQTNAIAPATLGGRLVSGFINDANIEVALEKLAFANDLKLYKTNDGVFVFQPLEDGEKLAINSENNPVVKKISKPINNGQPSGNYNIAVVKDDKGNKALRVDAMNAPIADLVKSASAEMGIDYFLYANLTGNVSTQLNNVSYDTFLGALLRGTEHTFKKEGGFYFIGERKKLGLKSFRVVKLQHRSLDTLKQMIPDIWQKDAVEIREFKEQNTLLLSGTAPEIDEVEQFIKQLDQVVPMVLIEVTLVDIRKGKSVSTGISAGVSDSVRTGGTILPGLNYTLGANAINDFLAKLGKNNSINLGRVSSNFYVKLSALENNNNVDIRSVPKLSTLNGHTANLSIGSSRFYSTKTQNVIPSLNAQTVVTEQFTEVNANLEIGISPVVAGDDQVTLKISVNISDFIGNPPLNAPPPKATSKFQSIIRARNEDMIVLGGLERTESSETGSGIPLLSRIPVLKWLFSSRQKATNKVVTLVFIKPTIMY